MLQAYSTGLTATGTMVVPFNTKAIQTSYVSNISSDGTTISLNLPGLYKVEFNGTATTTAAGDVAFNLLADGTAVAYAGGTATTGAGETASVSFSTYVKVQVADNTSVAQIQVEYEGDAGTIDLANIIVTRVR